MDFIKDEKSVSEILGTLILLIIAVVVVSAIIITVLSNLDDKSDIKVDPVGRLDDDSGIITIEHQGGETIDAKSRFLLYRAGNLTDPVDISLNDPSIFINDSGGNPALSGGWNFSFYPKRRYGWAGREPLELLARFPQGRRATD